MKKKKANPPAVVVPKNKAATRVGAAPPPTPPPPLHGKCCGCGEEDVTLVSLHRDTNPKDLFPNFIKDKSKACIGCNYHAMQVKQVREAMSYKLEQEVGGRQRCLVCNATTALMPMSHVRGAKEAVSHPIINAHNIHAHLKVPCSLCTSCAYPLQWLYNNVILRANRRSVLEKPEPATTPVPVKSAASKKSSRQVKFKADPEESSEEEEEAPVRTSRSKSLPPAKKKTPPAKAAKSAVVQRVQTPARTKRASPPESKKKDFWSSRQPQVIPSRTRAKSPRKRAFQEEEEEEQEEAPLPKRARVAPAAKKRFITPAARKQLPPVKKAPEPKKKRPSRAPKPTLSPLPDKKVNSRRKHELQERVCETCQQIFYSGTELALHELRHAGRLMRLSLDRHEIPEPVQSLQRSFLFQAPELVAPVPPPPAAEPQEQQQFEFQAPDTLEEGVMSLGEEEKDMSCNEDSNAETEQLVGNIIDSLEDRSAEDKGPEDKGQQLPEEVTPEKTPPTLAGPEGEEERSSTKAPTTASLSFDFFGPVDPPGLKTPPPASTTTTASLSFDFFDSPPSKDLFSPPPVDPSMALKPNSANPALPIPSDSDNSMTLTPPKDTGHRPVDLDKLENALRETIGDA